MSAPPTRPAPGRATVARRVLLVLLATAVALTATAGPARVGAALGLATAPDAAAPGFLPEPTPVRVTAPSLRLYGLTAITPGAAIPVAGGGSSPADTVLLQFSTIQLDHLAITQTDAGPFSLAIGNDGSGADAAQIGGTGQRVDLWGELHSLTLCLSFSTLTSLVSSYSQLLGGLLGTVQQLLGGLADAGPCPSLVQLLPLLGRLLQAGVPLPSPIPANDLDIDVYALHVSAGAGRTSLDLPHGRLVVSGR